MRLGKNIALQQSIVRTLLYFDLFRYPLTPEEIYKFLGTNSITGSDLQKALTDLVIEGHAFHHQGFYSIENGEELVKRRNAGNRNAQRISRLAGRRGKFIGMFPFVRGVMASGSFSKGYMDADSDLDFFIITAPRRLWVARMFIAFYKRVFLFNSHKYFCCNYFIAADDLEIGEKNLFTATELATLIPLSGGSHYSLLMDSNPWLNEFFPNFRAIDPQHVPHMSTNWFKSLVEYLLNGSVGDRLSHACQKVTRYRWKRLYSRHYPPRDFEIAFKSTASVSKNHPNHFQRRVLDRYDEKLRDFSKRKFRIEQLTDS